MPETQTVPAARDMTAAESRRMRFDGLADRIRGIKPISACFNAGRTEKRTLVLVGEDKSASLGRPASLAVEAQYGREDSEAEWSIRSIAAIWSLRDGSNDVVDAYLNTSSLEQHPDKTNQLLRTIGHAVTVAEAQVGLAVQA